MHMVAGHVASRPGVRLINIIDETALAVRAAGCQKPLLLATAYTMEHSFYAERMAAHGVQVLVPDAAGRAAVHDVIFEELCRGIMRPESRAFLMNVIASGTRAGADSVIFGCTEIWLLLDSDALDCSGFDSTTIHVRAAVNDALHDEDAQSQTA